MKSVNRFIALTKRILSKKIYILILVLLVVLTGVYNMLPAKSQSADIKVALYCKDEGDYFNELTACLDQLNSIYTFYIVDSEEKLLEDVKSGYAECGYLIPNGFFKDYVSGVAWDNPMQLYVTPSSTFHAVINETMFSSILNVCAEDTLLYAVKTPRWNRELATGLEYYRNSQDVFTISDTTSGEFTFESMIYHINLPVVETVSVILIFSGLLGLLLFLHDKERKMYVSLNHKELRKIKLLTITTSMIPVTVISCLSLAISYGAGMYVIFGILLSVSSSLLAIFLGLFIRKSTLLEKVLPLIMLTALIAVFIKTII